MNPSKHKMTVLSQIFKLIPRNLIPKPARVHGVDKQARSFSPNCALPRRFKRVINVIDSTTIKLVANCLDWAKHRRKKAAAKMHLRDLSAR